jgi:hypothetical protein
MAATGPHRLSRALLSRTLAVAVVVAEAVVVLLVEPVAAATAAVLARVLMEPQTLAAAAVLDLQQGLLVLMVVAEDLVL